MQRRPLIAAAAAAALFPKSSFTQTHDVVDVLVAGSGLAGHAAAIAAREEGAERVLVIEKGPVIGGHSAYSSGSLAVFSPALQNEQNLSDPIEEWLKDSLEIGGKINEPVVRAIIEESEAALRWLSSMGVDFSPLLFQAMGGLKPRCLAARSGLGGRQYIEKMHAVLADLDIDSRLSTELAALELNRSQDMWQAALKRSGKTKTILAKSVVLATGGFTANTSLRMFYDNRFSAAMRTTANPDGIVWDGAMGDGIRLAQQLGASIVDMHNILYLPYWGGRTLEYAGAEIYVNLEGDRFVNESSSITAIAQAMTHQSEQSMWVITDAKSTKGVNTGSKISSGRVHLSESIAEMARGMNIPAAKLESTLARYNYFARQKEDPDFCKEFFTQTIDTPPFYWGKEKLYVHCTLGGIEIDQNARVIDPAGHPLPRLYAAGETTGGIFGQDRLGGMSMSNALVMGRKAGRSAAMSL